MAMEGATATATAKAANGKRDGDVDGRHYGDVAEATTTMAMEGATGTATAKAESVTATSMEGASATRHH